MLVHVLVLTDLKSFSLDPVGLKLLPETEALGRTSVKTADIWILYYPNRKKVGLDLSGSLEIY